MSRRNKKERGPLTPKRSGFGMPPVGMQLQLVATTVEAAGSVQRAADLGLIGMMGESIEPLLALIPKSRGGHLEGPEVEQDWQNLVASIAAREGMSIEERRRSIEDMALEKPKET